MTRTRPNGDPITPLLIDYRRGSKELGIPLLKLDAPHEITTLDEGDIAFVGNGPDGACPIGIERKTISDLAQSLVSNRLQAVQLPRLMLAYSYAWLVVEGAWRVDDHGYVELPGGRDKGGAHRWYRMQPWLKADMLFGWLFSVELRGGIRVRTTRSLDDTARFLVTLRDWWTTKLWHEHRSHLALWQPPDAGIFERPSLVRTWAAALPGIGFDKSKLVDQHFHSALELACASEAEWRTIPGVGKTISHSVVTLINRVR